MNEAGFSASLIPVILYTSRCQLYYHTYVIGLYLCLVCSLISHHGTALVTFMYDNVALLGIGLCLDRSENSATVVGSVAGVYIDVQRAEAEGTVISRGVAERQHFFSAILAYKSAVVFCESFVFHIYSFGHYFLVFEEN